MSQWLTFIFFYYYWSRFSSVNIVTRLRAGQPKDWGSNPRTVMKLFSSRQTGYFATQWALEALDRVKAARTRNSQLTHRLRPLQLKFPTSHMCSMCWRRQTDIYIFRRKISTIFLF